MDEKANLERRGFMTKTVAGASVIAATAITPSLAKAARVSDKTMLELTASQAASAIRNGDMTSEGYARVLVKRCKELRDLNAFISMDENDVMAAARAADQVLSAGKPVGALHGVPICLKDNINTVGLPTTGATSSLANHRPPGDAPVAAACFRQGAILLGKTNLHELAFGITNNNGSFGAVKNPYDRRMIPGGSSGGTAAAVAARMVPAGLGSDTGGSSRIPAALCGIAGMRPTMGRWSNDAMVPISHTRDTAGPMARSVTDLALFDSIITGEAGFVSAAPLKGLRIGVPRAYYYENLDADLAGVIEAALRQLKNAGVVLVEADIPSLADLNNAVSFPIALYECGQDLPRYLQASGSKLTMKDIVAGLKSPDVKGVFETFIVGPKAIPKEVYESAINVGRPKLQSAYNDYFKQNNLAAMVFPTTPLPARPIGQDAEVEIGGKMFPTFPTYIRNTDPDSNAGIPGVSIPVGLTGAGLPVGIEFNALANQDRSLLGIALVAEALFGPLPAPRI